MTKRSFVKVARNAERFWCEVLSLNKDGSIRATVANVTNPNNPQHGEIIVIPADEWIYDTMAVEVLEPA